VRRSQRIEIAGLDRLDKGVDRVGDFLPASPGVIVPSAKTAVTAVIAAAISAALSIGGRAKLTGRSRQSGNFEAEAQRDRLVQHRELDGLAGQPLASPSSNAIAANVFLFRDPALRPTGFPDRPLSNGRPRGRRGGTGAKSSISSSPHIGLRPSGQEHAVRNCQFLDCDPERVRPVLGILSLAGFAPDCDVTRVADNWRAEGPLRVLLDLHSGVALLCHEIWRVDKGENEQSKRTPGAHRQPTTRPPKIEKAGNARA